MFIPTEEYRWIMAQLAKRILTYSNGAISVTNFVQWYMHKEDIDVFGSLRACVPCPAVFVLKDDPHVQMGQQWQYYLRAINYNMTLENVYLLLDDGLAFANNGKGFISLDNPGKADFFFNRSLSLAPPSLDKIRTTARSVLTGTEIMVNGQPTFLNVKVFDSRQPPPIKPGYAYPRDISEVNPNAYLYMPEADPERFLVANIVNTRGEVVQFPRGATYPWIDNGLTPYSFVPHIANLQYGSVMYPMSNLIKIPLGSPKPRAIRYL